MDTTTTTTREAFAYRVTVNNGHTERTLAIFDYESDALMFARAYFAGDNGGDVTVYNSNTNNISAFSFGNQWTNISKSTQTKSYNG